MSDVESMSKDDVANNTRDDFEDITTDGEGSDDDGGADNFAAYQHTKALGDADHEVMFHSIESFIFCMLRLPLYESRRRRRRPGSES